MNNKKHIVELESFREMLYICPRIPGQAFAELPFEEEILEFIRFLGHAIINKCLTGKRSGYDNLRLSQAQILWGLYHTRSIDYAFLIWEDFVYQVEHKNQKKSNEMYYPIFTKVIIHHFMSNDPSIPRRNKINWHYVRDDSIFSTIKIGGSGTDEGTGSKPGVPDVPIDELEEEISWNSSNDESDDAQEKVGDDGEGDEGNDSEEGEEDDDDDDEDKNGDEGDDDDQEVANHDDRDDTEESRDVDEEGESDEEDDNEETRDEESFNPISRTPESSEDEGNGEEDQGLRISKEERLNEKEEAEELYRDVNINQGMGIHATLDVEDSHVTLTPVHPDGQQESSFVSSQFVTSMLNPPSDAGMESIFATASSPVAPLQTSTPIMTPSTIATITTISHAPIPPTIIPSEVLQNLSTFDSVFRFEDILKSLEANFSKYIQTNPFAEAVSNIPEKDEFLQTIDENIKRIIKEQVKIQVKEQVSRILPRIKRSVNAQLEAKVHTRSSHSSRTSYAVAVDLSEMELKKILIEKMEGNKSIQRSDEQRNLYKALDEGPSARSDRGSKRRREGKEPESASAPLETATRSAGRSTTGSKSRKVSASESDFVEEPVQTISQMDEPSYPVFEIGKLSNLTVKERFAFNVSLRMFTRSIVIQRRVEDHQLGVESYQKRLNLTKPDTYWSDLKRKEAYTAYSNPRGFIYQNKDKKNSTYHKQSGEKGDKDRAAAMIQAIDKMLKTRRIMRSLEMFVGGRLYEGDFRMLQRTI
nr:hypothetical protein [Tanacetum cinerariifolium]